MWIFYALGSLFSESLETATDKIALVRYKNIDSLAATFLRVLMFCLIVGLCGLVGVFGELRIFLPWPVIVVGVLEVAASLAYTYLLKHIEATGSAVASYLTPLLFLLIDMTILKSHLSAMQICAIFLMVGGGVLFAVNPKTFHFKKEFTPIVWGLFLLNFIFSGFEYYSFKYYFNSVGLNEVSFLFSFTLVSVALLLVIILSLGKLGDLRLAATKTRYFAVMGLSKSFDSISNGLWLHAIAMASVAQVNATASLYPLMLIVVVYLAQRTFKFKAEEKFSQGHLAIKFAAVLLLCVGGFFIR